jgi:hypothetical protein
MSIFSKFRKHVIPIFDEKIIASYDYEIKMNENFGLKITENFLQAKGMRFVVQIRTIVKYMRIVQTH